MSISAILNPLDEDLSEDLLSLESLSTTVVTEVSEDLCKGASAKEKEDPLVSIITSGKQKADTSIELLLLQKDGNNGPAMAAPRQLQKNLSAERSKGLSRTHHELHYTHPSKLMSCSLTSQTVKLPI